MPFTEITEEEALGVQAPTGFTEVPPEEVAGLEAEPEAPTIPPPIEQDEIEELDRRVGELEIPAEEPMEPASMAGREKLPTGRGRLFVEAAEEFVTKDTYASAQAAALIAQGLDFVPGIIRGLIQGGELATETIIGKKGHARAEEMLRKMPILGRLHTEVEKVLDASGRLREETRKQLIEEAMEKGGFAGAAVAQLVDTVEGTLYWLKLFRLVGQPYGGKVAAPTRVARMGVHLRRAVVIAGLRTIGQEVPTEQLTWSNKLKQFAVSVAYMSTPAFSGWLGKTWQVVTADIALNSIISSAQWAKLNENARIRSEESGHPEWETLFRLLGAIEIAGADIVFGAMTRSFNPRTPPVVRTTVGEVQSRAEEAKTELNQPLDKSLPVEGKVEPPLAVKVVNDKDRSDWHTTVDRIVPADTHLRTEGERDEIQAAVGESWSNYLASHPEAAIRTEVTDPSGQKHIQLTAKPEYSAMAEASLKQAAGIEARLPATIDEQMKPEPMYAAPRPLPPEIQDRGNYILSALTDRPRQDFQFGLDQVSRVHNLTPENAEAMIDRMALPPAKGGVKGFGESTAAALKAVYRYGTPEEALSAYNNWRLSNVKEPIKPPPEVTPIIPRGAVRPEYKVTRTEELAIEGEMPWKKVDNKALGDQAFQAVLKFQNYPLPTDPDARATQMARLRTVFLSNYARSRGAESNWRAQFRAVSDYARTAGSMRYMIYAWAQRTGDMSKVDNYNDLIYARNRAEYDVGKRYQEIFKSSNVPEWELATRPDIEKALVDLLWTDPRAEGAKETIATARVGLEDYTSPKRADTLLKKLAKAKGEEFKKLDAELGKMAIPFDDPRNRWAKLHRAIVAELQGPTATYVRWNQLNRWTRAWERHGPIITDVKAKIATLEKQEPLSQEEQKQLTNLRGRLKDQVDAMEKATPTMTVTDEAGKQTAEKVSQDTMINMKGIQDTQGDEAVRMVLAGETWGTRRVYWLSDQADPDGYFKPVPPTAASELLFAEGGTRPGVTEPSRVLPREDEGQPIIERVARQLYGHMFRMETRALANRSAERLLSDTYTDPELPGIHREQFTRMIDNAVGKSQPVSDMTKTMIFFNRIFWKSYPLAISRLMYYTSRNVMQNFALGPSQVGVRNFAISATRFVQLLKNPNSRLRQAFNQDFEEQVSQWRAAYRQVMREEQAWEKPELRGPLLGARTILDNFAMNSLGWSDRFNRTVMWSIAYDTADRHTQSLLAGRITQGRAEKNMLLDNMPVAESANLAKLLGEGMQRGTREGMEPFIKRYAEVKNENTNFIYRNIGRSGLEQDIHNRPVLGIMTWPKGAAEVLGRNGVGPIIDGLRTNNPGKVWQGSRTVGLYIFGMYMAGVAHATLFGSKKRGDRAVASYHPLMSVWWEPLSPGASRLGSAISVLTAIQHAEPGSPALNKAVEVLSSQAVYLIPVLADIGNWYETFGDKRAAGNVRWILERIEYGTDFAEAVERGWFDKTRHFFFATEIPTVKQALTAPLHLPYTRLGEP